MNSQDDRCLPVEMLSTRYSIGKTAVYTRIKALGIQPEKLGNRAYVTASQIALLDELHAHIRSGGITPVFLQGKGLHPYDTPSATSDSAGQSVELSSGLILSQSDVGKLARAMAKPSKGIATEITSIFKKRTQRRAIRSRFQKLIILSCPVDSLKEIICMNVPEGYLEK